MFILNKLCIKKKRTVVGVKKRGGSRSSVKRGVSSRRSVNRGVSSRRSVNRCVSSRRERVIISRGKSRHAKSRHAKSRHAKSRHAMRGGDTKTKVAAAVVAATGLAAVSASYYKNHVSLKQKLKQSFDTFKELEREKIVELLGHFEIRLDTNLLDKVQEEFDKIKSGGITSTKVVDDHHDLQSLLPKQKDNYNDFFKNLIVYENHIYTHSQSSASNVVFLKGSSSAHTAARTIVLLLLLWYYFDCSFTTLWIKENIIIKIDQFYLASYIKVIKSTLTFANVVNSATFDDYNRKNTIPLDKQDFDSFKALEEQLKTTDKKRLDCLKKFNLNQELEDNGYE